MNDDSLFSQAMANGQLFFLAADHVDNLRERILAPAAEHLGRTRYADTRTSRGRAPTGASPETSLQLRLSGAGRTYGDPVTSAGVRQQQSV
jgi:hypothetical protein